MRAGARSTHRRRRVLSFVVAAGLVGAGTLGSCRAADQFHYRGRHSLFGDIGTYSNAIDRSGSTVTVRTTVHLAVTAIGVVLHREDAERIEQWKDDRLVYFRGVTTINGDIIEVKGDARADSFVITSPLGNAVAPAAVIPSNPSSLKLLRSATIMRTDTGKIENVNITGDDKLKTVDVNGVNIPAREYQIDGSVPYKIWIDQKNIPVRFAVIDDSGEIVFTLVR
ncbi:MAG TPA: DUF6134 family protein [Stellaceae bacterium]|nr:DUF6134 family protein [Stellaceae bacterium]